MKRILLLAGLTLLFVQAFSQVQRNVVVLEIGTGTWCTYCPGAANGAHDLLANGAQVAVIENHNGDTLANTYSNTRNSYYSISSFPTAMFDGVVQYVGGQACPNGNVYSAYLTRYNQRYAIPSPLVVDISGTNSGSTYNIVLSVKKLAAVAGTDLRLHLVVVESDIATGNWPGSGGCMTEVNHVNRLMVPSASGTSISFASGDMQIVTLSFTKASFWDLTQCEIVAFVQDYATKEIFNGAKVAMNSIPLPIPVDFSGAPTTGCIPLTTNFTDLSTGVTNWQWEFQGGTPATSTAQNPAVVYNAYGNNNVTLTAWNNVTNRGNKMVKTAYINPSAAPLAPGTPTGQNNLCENPSNQTYNTTGVTNATSYTWDLQPPAAGVLTPNGLNCTVDWSNTYIGTATLKVRGSNACGDGAWSSNLNITINSIPAIPGTPTGPTSICQDAPNSVYTSSGSPVATGYTWQLTPSTAGSITYTMTSATVDWNPAFTGTAEVKVLANNNTCQSDWSAPCVVTVNGGPAIFAMTGGGVYCAQGGTGIEVGLNGSQSGVDYTLYLNGSPTTTIIPGTGSPISFGLQTGTGTYTAVGVNTATCPMNMTGNAVVATDPQAPEAPAMPTGPEEVYSESNPTSDYTTAGGLYAATYTWQVSPTEAGTASGTTTTGTITWDPGFEGTATVSVQGVNTCGGGTFSEEISVDVFPWFVGIGDPENSSRISVYPNPVDGILTIRSKETMTVSVELISLVGTTVMQKHDQTIGRNYRLDLSALVPGIYFLRISGSDYAETLKLVVK